MRKQRLPVCLQWNVISSAIILIADVVQLLACSIPKRADSVVTDIVVLIP